MRISQAAQQMLDGTILPFWLGLRDEENGGFYGYLDFDLNLDKKAEKGCILNSRILWFFSESAMLTPRPDLRDAADHAFRFLLQTAAFTGASPVTASRWIPPSTPTIRRLPSMRCPPTTA